MEFETRMTELGEEISLPRRWIAEKVKDIVIARYGVNTLGALPLAEVNEDDASVSGTRWKHGY